MWLMDAQQKNLIHGYGGYFKKNKKMPLGGITLNHKFNSGSIGLC